MDLLLEGIDLGLLSGLVAGLLDILEQARTAADEVLVAEAPVVGLLALLGGVDADGLVLHLAKAVEVELTDEGAEIVVFEVSRDDGRGEGIGILDDEGCAVRIPFANVWRAVVDH